MWDDLLECLGPVTETTDLKATKALAFAELLLSGVVQQGHLIEVRQGSELSTVVFEVSVEVGQAPKNDIRRSELIAVAFDISDQCRPDVFALRPDFPRAVPHLNLPSPGFPPSLCLSEQSYSEAKRRWTPIGFLQSIRDWLALTARDELHQEGQSLEPFLMKFDGHLIIPHSMLSQGASSDKPLYGYRQFEPEDGSKLRRVVRLSDEDIGAEKNTTGFVAALFKTPPRQHGAINSTPRTLQELAELVRCEGFDLLEDLAIQLNSWKDISATKEAIPVLLLQSPVTRTEGGPEEDQELWAFILDHPVWEVGERLGLWGVHQDQSTGDRLLVPLIEASVPEKVGDIRLSLLNPHLTLSPERSAKFNQLQLPEDTKIVAVGAGALGSQVLMGLRRLGVGVHHVLDQDLYLPHNLARHLLTDHYIGSPKAIGVANDINCVLDGGTVTGSLVIDVLNPGGKSGQLQAALDGAEHILDLSASVAVGRHLSNELAGEARCHSVFLNPTGSDLIVLSEDADRTIPLDQLEMQYYWALTVNDDLAGHLDAPGRTRYAQGCQDVSSRISHANIMVHAGVACKVIRNALDDADARVSVWRIDEGDNTVTNVSVPVLPMVSIELGEWNIFISEDLIEMLAEQRGAKLPNETGGVLIGDCDMEHNRIYLVGSIPAPPDSKEWPTHYIRGSRGLLQDVKSKSDITDGMLRYMGEWHSHPDGHSTHPSDDDQVLYGWLAAHMCAEGYPPVMLIVGQGRDILCIVDGEGAPVTA